MKHRQTRTSADKQKLNKRWVRQMLRGYRALNKITAAERRAWLERMTVEEARKIFDELHQDTDRWKEDGGDLDALEQRRLGRFTNFLPHTELRMRSSAEWRCRVRAAFVARNSVK
jgi:hypothetical protein